MNWDFFCRVDQLQHPYPTFSLFAQFESPVLTYATTSSLPLDALPTPEEWSSSCSAPVQQKSAAVHRTAKAGRPLGMGERRQILALYERGHKISHIARIIGVTHSCVSKIMSRYRRTGSMHPRSSRLSESSSSRSDCDFSDANSFASSESDEQETETTMTERTEEPQKKKPLPYSIEKILS